MLMPFCSAPQLLVRIPAGGWIIGACLILLGAVSTAPAAGSPLAADPTPVPTPLPEVSNTPLVLTYAFYWYDAQTGAHLEPKTLKYHLPSSPRPSWKNVAWHKKQLQDMSAAGIDVALMVYWGRTSGSDAWSYDGLQNLVTAWQQLRAEGNHPPAIALFLDTTIVGGRDLTTATGKSWFYQQFRDFFEVIPSSMWGTVNGKPVTFLFTSDLTGAMDQGTFDYVYSNFQADFRVRPYIVREVSWDYPIRHRVGNLAVRDTTRAIKTENSYIWGAAFTGFVERGGVATVGPGYDDRHLRPNGVAVDRRSGDFYIEQFRKAIASGKPLLAIETWNEIHEGSNIAETLELGRDYIDLTADLVREYKQAIAGVPPAVIKSAPVAVGPLAGATLHDLSLSLRWSDVEHATQYHIQVLPVSNDGLGIDTILFSGSFNLAAPRRGDGPYVMLPGMSYSWRVRASGAAGSIGPGDASWGPWSSWETFYTPTASGNKITAESPASGAVIPPGDSATVRWGDLYPSIFYYEIMMSTDSAFGGNGPLAAVWHNLVHGGISDPLNSWRTPKLTSGATYYWRVRPRVQGDGPPVAWSSTFNFLTENWSSNRIAYTSFASNNLHIFTMSPDGGDVTQVAASPSQESFPAWSPDGRKLAFTSDRSGDWDIYVLTVSSASVDRLTSTMGIDTSPAWSPDGARLAFTSYRDGNAEIYVMDSDGGNQKRLTNSFAEDSSPTWSNDSQRIAFSGRQGAGADIYIMDADGSNLKRLTDNVGDEVTPAFSLDGRYIAFSAFRDDNWGVYVMDSSGSGQRSLTSGPEANFMPAWSPDGNSLAYVSDRGGNWEIYVLTLATGEQRRITNTRGAEALPSWSR